MRKDPQIRWRYAAQARAFQLLYPVINRLLLSSPKVDFATRRIAPPRRISIPTRHGLMGALLFVPPGGGREGAALSEGAPLHILVHGGAFILQYPMGEAAVARYLASEVGCHVLMPDYHAAPQVRHPVAEDECHDTFSWAARNADDYGWDAGRISIGGPSAGGSIALGVALNALEQGQRPPVAVTLEFAPVDLSRPDSDRTSIKSRPVVGPSMMALVRNTYFAQVPLDSPGVSPAGHPLLGALPPSLIITAEYDTLRAEGDDLAARLTELGVETTHRCIAGVDHGFIYHPPVEPAREAITLIGSHLASAYARASRSWSTA